MVGVCGVIGDGERNVREAAQTLAWTGEERPLDFRDGSFHLIGYTHPTRDARLPGRTPGGDALVWVWGNVLGFRGDDGYRARDPESDDPPAAYCARLYDEHGRDFAAGLNGDYVGLVYDRARSTVSVFTDRLGSWRLFHTTLDDGTVVFTSHVQSLERFPAVSLAFDEAYVLQHLTDAGGPFGVKTPLRGVELFHPGAVTTYALDGGRIEPEVDVYWRPRFDPTDGPYEDVVDEFVDRFRASVRDRTRDTSLRYGLLLSGGTDSRLVLAALRDDIDLVAFHMADWMSREARIAERVAMSKGVEFRFLRRDPDYYGRLLERTPPMWNFTQLYTQAWAEGFMDEIRAEVDVLLTGHFCDTLFKGWFVPKRTLSVGPIGPVGLPFERPIQTVEDYVRETYPPAPTVVDTETATWEVLRENVEHADGGVEGYGVTFDSLRDFVLGVHHYPATSDSFFRQSLREHLPLQMPALDDRLLALWEHMPVRYQLRRNVVAEALKVIDPELAAIPHARSGLPPATPKLRHRLGTLRTALVDRLSPFEAVPGEWMGRSPWGDLAAVIRHRPFVGEAIQEEEDLIRALPFLDWESVVDCYEDHRDGHDNTRELLRLVTLVKAPVTRAIAERA